MTHLSAEDLAAYLDATLAPDTRHAVEAHLAECRTCRAEMLETRRILRAHDHAPPRIRVLAPFAAAAVVAAVFLWPSGEPGSTPRLRTDAPAGLQESIAIIPVRPAAIGSATDPGSVTLAWDSVGPRLDYRITVVDAHGETVWTGTSTETRLTLPAEIEETGDSVFFWFVDATLETGEAATSGVQEFRIR